MPGIRRTSKDPEPASPSPIPVTRTRPPPHRQQPPYAQLVTARWTIEVEPEVRDWLNTLPVSHYRMVERHADRLAESPTPLSEPYSRHLQGAVRELRFILGTEAVRITYWLAPNRRIVLLTVFRKTRMREESQVQRALWKQKECESEHPPACDTYHRGFEEQE